MLPAVFRLLSDKHWRFQLIITQLYLTWPRASFSASEGRPHLGWTWQLQSPSVNFWMLSSSCNLFIKYTCNTACYRCTTAFLELVQQILLHVLIFTCNVLPSWIFLQKLYCYKHVLCNEYLHVLLAKISDYHNVRCQFNKKLTSPKTNGTFEHTHSI